MTTELVRRKVEPSLVEDGGPTSSRLGRRTRASQRTIEADVQRLREEFDQQVLSVAKRLGLSDGNLRLKDLISRSESGESIRLTATLNVYKSPALRKAGQKAALDVRLWGLMYFGLVESIRLTPQDGSIPDSIVLLRGRMNNLCGYLAAISDMRSERANPATAGRIKAGEQLRHKVRDAVAHLKTGTKKEAAGSEIATLVSRSPATIRRILGDMYPGEEWKPGKSD